MITFEDLNPHQFEMTEDQKNNLISLAEKLTQFETAFGSLFKITSGLRSIEDHYRIYREKGIDHVPMGSQHLRGNAADISDLHGTLKEFCLSEKGMQLLEELDLYCEAGTKGWQHFQQIAPLSGKRFFQP